MQWWLVPVCTAISSWISLRLILFFLFSPVQQLRVGLWKIQGYVPRNMDLWTHQLTEFAVKTLVADKRLTQYLTAPSTLQPMMPFIESHIDDFLRHKLGKAMPVVSMFVGDKTINQMKGIFMKELEVLLPAVIGRFIDESLHPEKLRPLIHKELVQLTHHAGFEAFQQQMKSRIALLSWMAGGLGLITGMVLVAIIYTFNVF